MATNWKELRDERMSSPEAQAAYEASRTAYEFGRRVRERREERGLSQAELAREVGTSQPAIARLEAGGTEPTLRTIARLARALGTVWAISSTGVTQSGGTDATSPPAKPSRRTT